MAAIAAKLRAVRRRGATDAARRAAELALHSVYLRQSHVWHELPLTEDRKRPALPEPYVQRKAATSELSLVERLGQSSDAAAEHVAAGNDCWLVLDEEEPVFCCWVFRSRSPVAGSPGGRLELPPGVACVEDVVTAADHRGEGIAPAAYANVADSLAIEGYRSVIMKVDVENEASLRAAGKAGFVEIAETELKRTAFHTRLSLAAASTAPTAAALIERLFF